MTQINDFILLSQIDENINEIESSQGDLPNRIKKLELTKKNLEENKTNPVWLNRADRFF